MKKYRFRITGEEARELYFKVLRKKGKGPGKQSFRSETRVVLAVLLGLGCIAYPALLGIVLPVAAIIFGIMGHYYLLLKRKLCQETQVVWVEDGYLKVETEGKQHVEFSCQNVIEIRMTSALLVLGICRASKTTGWYAVPLRVFADEKEREEFVDSIRSHQTLTGEEAEEAAEEQGDTFPGGDSGERIYFRQCFRLDGEDWARLMTDAAEAIEAGTLRKRGKGRPVWIGITAAYLVFLGVSVWLLARGVSDAQWLVGIALIMGVFFSSLIQSRLEKPEDKMRQQMEKGAARDTCGDFTVSVTETGVWQSIQNPSGKTNIMTPWENLLCMVETDAHILFFEKDGKEFMALFKARMEGREQIECLKALCREKRVEVLWGKRKKYAPGWISPLLKVATVGLIMAFSLCIVWGKYREPAVPKPVSFEEQISVLRSLEFIIPDDMEQLLYDYMEEADMLTYVENYPYTWILMELAWANEDRDWSDLLQSSAEVFWFDFEAWDISEDYVWILEGMRELSAGSILDDVGNIREDTENVDWEKGTGTITISLEWKGQEHFWEMDVENDWIDPDVLGIYNGLLKKEGASERFYVTGDDGQGALVFYGTKEWAAAFENATGLELEVYMVKKGW